MSEVPSLSSYSDYASTHQERASVFIGDEMTHRDRTAAIDMASAFESKDKTASKTAVLIPVAAHQDSAYILPTLSEYAKQKTTKPFTVFLSLNAPLNAANIEKVAKAEEAVEQARDMHPQLDVRSSTTLYDEPTIGLIRRDLWNAAFLLAHYEHGFSEDVIGINNDIDAAFISPHYVSRTQQYYERKNRQYRQLFGETVARTTIHNTLATRVTHAILPSHPNIGKVTTWADNTCFQAPGHIAYEAGMVIPFSRYAFNGGFDAKSVTHETARLYADYHRPYTAGAQLYTSPRRYIDRLQEHDTTEIWTTDSFGSDDNCRNVLPPDISNDRAEDMIFDRLNRDLEKYWLPSAVDPVFRTAMLKRRIQEVSRSETLSQVTNAAEKQLSKAERLLGKMIGSQVLADIINESFDAHSYAERHMARFDELCRASEGSPG